MQELIIGVDIGRTSIKLGLVDMAGGLEGELIAIPTEADRGPKSAVDRIAKCVADLRGKASSGREIVGIGVGCPGPLDREKGVVLNPPNLPAWAQFELAEAMRRATGVNSVSLENDANAAALAEYWCGAGRGTRCMLLMGLGTGVGGGIVLDGRLWAGVSGIGGELGHLTVDPDGLKCGCGNRGCLEAFASAPAIQQRAEEAARAVPASLLATARGKLTPEVVHGFAVQGDAAAKVVLEETARYIGIAAAGLVNIFDPDAIVISGGVSAAFDILLPVIMKEIRERSFQKSPERGPLVVKSDLGDHAGVVGGAAAFLHRERMMPRPWGIDRVRTSVFIRGLHIGRSGTEAAIVRLSGREREIVGGVVKVDQGKSKREIVARALQCAGEAVRRSGVRERDIRGTGISTPGPVDWKAKRIGEVPNMRWADVNLEEEFRSFGGALFVEKDADASALAELRFGRGRGTDDFIVLYLGSGTGAGIIIGGAIYRGFSGTAGEIGHQTIAYWRDALECACGGRGCVEVYASGPTLLEQVRSAAKAGIPTSVSEKALAGTLEYRDVCRAADEGDEICMLRLQDMGSVLGIAIANYLNLMNPKKVVVAGPLAGAWLHFEVRLWDEVRSRTFGKVREGVLIEPTGFGEHGDVLGAAAAFAEQWRPGG